MDEQLSKIPKLTLPNSKEANLHDTQLIPKGDKFCLPQCLSQNVCYLLLCRYVL